MQSVYSAALIDWVTGHSLGKFYPSAKMRSVYSTAPADWATVHSLGESYPSLEMQSVYSATPDDWVSETKEGFANNKKMDSTCYFYCWGEFFTRRWFFLYTFSTIFISSSKCTLKHFGFIYIKLVYFLTHPLPLLAKNDCFKKCSYKARNVPAFYGFLDFFIFYFYSFFLWWVWCMFVFLSFFFFLFFLGGGGSEGSFYHNFHAYSLLQRVFQKNRYHFVIK